MHQTAAPIQKLWPTPQRKVIDERHPHWVGVSAFYLMEGCGCPWRSPEGVWGLGGSLCWGLVRACGSGMSLAPDFGHPGGWGMALVSAGVLAQVCNNKASASHVGSLGRRQTAWLQIFYWKLEVTKG